MCVYTTPFPLNANVKKTLLTLFFTKFMAPFPRLHVVEGHHGTLPLEALLPELLVLLLVALGRNSWRTTAAGPKQRGRTLNETPKLWLLNHDHNISQWAEKPSKNTSLGEKNMFWSIGIGFWSLSSLSKFWRCPDLVQESAARSWAHLGSGRCLYRIRSSGKVFIFR